MVQRLYLWGPITCCSPVYAIVTLGCNVGCNTCTYSFFQLLHKSSLHACVIVCNFIYILWHLSSHVEISPSFFLAFKPHCLPSRMHHKCIWQTTFVLSICVASWLRRVLIVLIQVVTSYRLLTNIFRKSHSMNEALSLLDKVNMYIYIHKGFDLPFFSTKWTNSVYYLWHPYLMSCPC